MTHFIHTADWQIGRQYGQFEPEDAALLAEARLEVVGRIASEATVRGAQAILVAGDVFDMQGLADRTIRRLFAALEGFSGPWVLIAGNHDAALADSVWTRAQRLGCVPPHVHIPMEPGLVLLPECHMAVLAAPLTQRRTFDDVTALFDTLESPADWIRVGLAHGSIGSRLPAGADVGNPIAPERAARARLDYLALGDWHGCLRIDERTWYAGTPETDRFRGNEPGAMLSVRIDKPGDMPHVQRVDVGRFRWSTLERRITVPSDVEALATELKALDLNDVLQLSISGDANLLTWERLQEVVSVAAGLARSVRFDASALKLHADESDMASLGASGYVLEVAETLQAMQETHERLAGTGQMAPSAHDIDQGAQRVLIDDRAIAQEALRLLLQYEREISARTFGGTQVSSAGSPETSINAATDVVAASHALAPSIAVRGTP